MQYKYLSQQNKGCTTDQSQEECSEMRMLASSVSLASWRDDQVLIKEGELALCSGCSRNLCPLASLASPCTPSSPLRPRPRKRKMSRRRRKNYRSLRNCGRPEVSP